MPVGLQEGDIKAGLAEGGRVLNAIIVCRWDGEECEHLPYFHASWGRGLRPLRTMGDRADRTYRDLNRLLALIRQDFDYPGYVAHYFAGDAQLAPYKGLVEIDQRVASKVSRPNDSTRGGAA